MAYLATRTFTASETGFSPGPLVDEIASLIMSQSWTNRGLVIRQVLNTVFRTGDIGAGNEILSLFITRNPDLSACLGKVFSWENCMIFLPSDDFLGRNSKRTQELLKGCGADPNCILYYRMTSVVEIAYWEEVLGEGVDDKVLNSLLLFSAAKLPAGFVAYLLSKGASVHYQASIAEGFQRGWNSLAFAAYHGKTETVMLLLNNGADVLQELMDYRGKMVTASQLASQDLVRMLAQIEFEERVKRDTTHSSPPPDTSTVCPFGGNALIGY